MPYVSVYMNSVRNISVIIGVSSNSSTGNDQRGSIPGILGGMSIGRGTSGVAVASTKWRHTWYLR